MSKESNLKKLLGNEFRAYKKKRDAKNKYQAACEKEHELYEEVASTWGEYKKAERDFRATFNENSLGVPSSNDPWQKYLCIKARNNPEVARLRAKAEAEEETRIQCLRQIETLREEGHPDEIGALKLEAKDHEDARKRISNEILDLKGEILEARIKAEKSENFLQKKKKMEDALAHHQSAKFEHHTVLKERNRLKLDYERAEAAHKEAVKVLREEQAKAAQK